MNTRVEYLYRDACNYKAWQEVIFAGEITEEDKQKIANSLEDETYFIPEQVHLPLYMPWPVTEDDHCFCELYPDLAFELTDKEPTHEGRTIHDLAQDFADQKYWDAVTYAVVPDEEE